MPEPIITVANLGKRYVLTHEQRHDTLRDTLVHGARGLLRHWRGGPDPTREEFWALRDVNFSVNRGEVVGIIGRNGAGKSTLLKILSRITEPTTGRVGIRGRVASLLEVGTGFHPELSGRENIHLNGAILGMSRAEIRSKFDEIVAFAEVERFLDTPVKHYSSGMYVRLAFAVAAHLEPEILIIDEVLAVGDAAFQKKCLGKMESVATKKGRTILFVSHNLAAVQRLCTRALYLEGGRVKIAGTVSEAEQQFLADLAAGAAPGSRGIVRNDNPDFTVTEFSAVVAGATSKVVGAGESVTFRLRYRCAKPAAFADGISVSVIFHVRGQRILNLWSEAGRGSTFKLGAEGEIACEVPRWPFRGGPVSVDVHASYRMQNILEWEEALFVDSVDGDFYGTGIVPHESEGLMFLLHQWRG